MATFSVWNFHTRQYDHYEAGQYQGTHVTTPTTGGLLGSELGMTPEQFAVALPVEARKVGSSMIAQGRIASTGLGLGSIPNWLLYGVLAYVAWRVFR